MSLAFYMDEHVPRPITIGLRIRQVDVLTAQEDDHRETDDDILIDRAGELGRVMFSFDADMLREATRRQEAGESFSGVIFAHPTQISVGECIRDLEIMAEAGEPEDLQNRVFYLPL
jgi:hypothetical protein